MTFQVNKMANWTKGNSTLHPYQVQQEFQLCCMLDTNYRSKITPTECL